VGVYYFYKFIVHLDSLDKRFDYQSSSAHTIYLCEILLKVIHPYEPKQNKFHHKKLI